MSTLAIDTIAEYGTGYAWTNRTVNPAGQDGDENRYYLGKASSNNYRSRFTITIPSTAVIAKSEKLVIAMKADETATPACMRGFLTTTNYSSSDTDYITGDGEHIEMSYLWLDENKTNRATAYQPSGGVWCYLVFDQTQFTAGTTYYVHILPYASDSASNTTGYNFASTWWRGRNNGRYLSFTLYYTSGIVRIWNGSAWKEAIPYIWNGSVWKQTIPYVWNGSAWKQGG